MRYQRRDPLAYLLHLLPLTPLGKVLLSGAFKPELMPQVASDNESLYLIGSLVDLADLGVAHHTLNRELFHISVAAQNLDGVVGHFHGNIGSIGLRDRGLAAEAGAALVY